MSFIIENTEIGLRKTAPEEIDAVYEMESQEENSRYVMGYSRERHLRVIDQSDEEHLVIFDKADNTIAGFVILAGLDNPNLSLEFRRMVIKNKGKGIGRQVLKLLKQYCFTKLGFHRMWLDVYEDNEGAIHLYKSEGFIREGKLRDVIKDGSGYRSLLIFSLLEGEYKV